MIVYDKPRWIHVVFMLRGAALVVIWKRLAFVTLVSVLITYMHEQYGRFHESVTLVPFSLIGIALGIFLGFRNNTSYDRFWEGRKLWGRLVNVSRTLTRQIMTLDGPVGGHPDLVARQKQLVYRLIAYVHLFRQHLREEDGLDEVAALIPPEELESLRSEHNRPIALLHRMGDDFRRDWEKGWIDSLHFPTLEASLTELTTVQGACERIKSTPIPFSYNVLLHRIVGIYCLTLPFGLVAEVGPVTPIVVALISYAFFALDAVGGEIENPFGLDANDLPLGALSRMIEINLRQRLGEIDLPPFAEPVDYILT